MWISLFRLPCSIAGLVFYHKQVHCAIKNVACINAIFVLLDVSRYRGSLCSNLCWLSINDDSGRGSVLLSTTIGGSDQVTELVGPIGTWNSIKGFNR